MFNMNFGNDWSQTADLWYRKQLLYNWATTTSQTIGMLYYQNYTFFHFYQSKPN